MGDFETDILHIEPVILIHETVIFDVEQGLGGFEPYPGGIAIHLGGFERHIS